MSEKYQLKRTGRNLIYGGSVFNFYEDTMELPDGREEKWQYVEHRKGGGACTVAILENGEILMIRQYRPAIDAETLELPAGARDKSSEDPALTAARELKEETGYSCTSVEKLVTLKTAVSWCNEETDVYLALGVKKDGGQKLDPAEEIKVESCPVEQVRDMIFSGQITDAKTVAGVLAYLARCTGQGS